MKSLNIPISITRIGVKTRIGGLIVMKRYDAQHYIYLYPDMKF